MLIARPWYNAWRLLDWTYSAVAVLTIVAMIVNLFFPWLFGKAGAPHERNFTFLAIALSVAAGVLYAAAIYSERKVFGAIMWRFTFVLWFITAFLIFAGLPENLVILRDFFGKYWP